jgi:hypothetical protein
MYSEDDLFVFDEFFSIDYIAGHLRHLVNWHILVDAVQKLRPWLRTPTPIQLR